jgi:hypothetical protein
MPSVPFDVPLTLDLAAVAVLGALQALAYAVAGRGLVALGVDATGLERVAGALVLFAAGAGTAGALGPAHPTGATLGSLALGVAVLLFGFALRRRAAWRVGLADPTAARRLGLAVGPLGAAALAVALAVMAAVAGLGTGTPASVPGWAPLLAGLALRPAPAVGVAALAGAADVAVVEWAPAAPPGDVAGLLLAAAALALPAWRAEPAA